MPVYIPSLGRDLELWCTSMRASLRFDDTDSALYTQVLSIDTHNRNRVPYLRNRRTHNRSLDDVSPSHVTIAHTRSRKSILQEYLFVTGISIFSYVF